MGEPSADSETGHAFVRYPFGGAEYGSLYPLTWRPLPGEAYACLALVFDCGNTGVEAFGLCDVREGWGPGVPEGDVRARASRKHPAAWRCGELNLPEPLYSRFLHTPVAVVLGEMVFRVTGDPTDKNVQKVLRDARAWWKRLKVAWKGEGGRPPGRVVSAGEIRRKHGELRAAGLRAFKVDVATELGIDARTLDRVLRDAGLTWQQARQG